MDERDSCGGTSFGAEDRDVKYQLFFRQDRGDSQEKRETTEARRTRGLSPEFEDHSTTSLKNRFESIFELECASVPQWPPW